MKIPEQKAANVMGISIDAGSWDAFLQRILTRAAAHQPGYVCQCNVHSIATAQKDPQLRAALDNAYLRAPDGAPVTWMVRRYADQDQPRIGGPDLMWKICECLEGTDQSIYLLGSTEETLTALDNRLREEFPELNIAGTYSPPFRPLTDDEQQEIIDELGRSGANIVFVGLGCPKQEIWSHSVSPQVPAILIGVGAAFDFHAGIVQRAPEWAQRFGLEWVHRLMQEPRRLWRRYLETNLAFGWYAIKRVLRDRGSPRSRTLT